MTTDEPGVERKEPRPFKILSITDPAVEERFFDALDLLIFARLKAAGIEPTYDALKAYVEAVREEDGGLSFGRLLGI